MLIEKTYDIIPPNAAEKVLLYILEHVDRNLFFYRTYDQIQKDTGASQPTISKVFRVMQDAGAIEHVGKTKWKLTGIAKGWSDTCDGFDFFVENKGS